jgi:hypothetical protein
VDGYGPLVLGKTCRYCTPCEFIIAHQEELEGELAYQFSQRLPEVVGNPYLVLGVVERRTWQKGMRERLAWEELLEQTADIKQHMELHDPRPTWVYVGGDRPPTSAGQE